MTAYVLFIREGAVRDVDAMQTYGQLASALPADPKLTPLSIYGAIEQLEGAPVDGIVMLKFPTVDDARNWYRSPGYQEAARHRRLAADYRVIILEGF